MPSTVLYVLHRSVHIPTLNLPYSGSCRYSGLVVFVLTFILTWFSPRCRLLLLLQCRFRSTPARDTPAAYLPADTLWP